MTVGPSQPATAVPKSLRLEAAIRLMGGDRPENQRAARRLLDAAPKHGIDPSLFFGVIRPDEKAPRRVGPVCLAVPGAGRTAMLFLSSPASDEGAGAGQDRGAAVRAAIDHLRADTERGISIVQALPSPEERWAVAALELGGLHQVGKLAYLRRELTGGDKLRVRGPGEGWGDGIRVEALGDPAANATWSDLATALERSYEKTLDCPELCGIRSLDDVVASHRSAGEFDPSLWRLVRLDGRPVGCCLINRNPEMATVELVYLGLGPEVRGRRLGSRLLDDAIGRAARDTPERALTCAVDRANTPAWVLYEHAGFSPFASRLAYVAALRR